MNSKMTPCEKLGYKVGDKFKVVDGTGVLYAVGSFITLIHDDGTSCPRFNGVHATYESGDSFFPLDSVEKVAKLKPAKQALADAIHQNGGWIEQANYAVQSGGNLRIHFTDDDKKPVRCAGGKWKCQYGFMFLGSTIPLKSKLKNWHQCVLSREEYYHAYPKADADGWIEWSGEPKSQVENGVLVDVKLKGGGYHEAELLDDASWSDAWGDESIIAYRLHKQEAKPEFCESVTHGIPEPESIDRLCAKVTEENKHQHVDAKPTIEQLAQDYRNKLDFANHKHQEADEAKAAADAALGELERAGEVLGLLIGIANPDREPGLAITDWRDLQVNDVLFVGECDGYESGEYVVVWLEDSDYDGYFAVIVVGIDGIERCMDTAMEWRFISRP